MDLGIKGHSAIVTASSSGLGKASAKSLLQEGANVVINGRNQEKLAKTVKELKKTARGQVIGQPGDITVKKDIERLVDVTYQKFGCIDHLVISSGGPPAGSFMEMEDEDWYQAFDLLVMSVVRLIRCSLPYLKEGQGGTIVNITSISVKEAIDNLILSNSVRMSVIGLMKTLSRELSPEIRINAVLPGAHETDRIKNLIQDEIDNGKIKSYQEGLNKWSSNIPLKRIGAPQELGDVVAFLSSNKSSYINGAAIRVDGGRSRANL